MPDAPLTLTIYTVFYNRETSLDDSVQSLLESAPATARIVLIDDCSTDNTGIQLQNFCSDSRVRFYQGEENKGFTRALTDAIEALEKERPSEFIAIHGAGDLSLRDRFSEQINFLRENEHSFVACRHRFASMEGRLISESRFSGEVAPVTLGRNPGPWTHGSIMYRANAYFDVGGYQREMSYCQDWELNRRLLRMGRGYVLDQCLYEKRMFADGASFNPKKRLVQLYYSQLILSGRLHGDDRATTLAKIESQGIEKVVETRTGYLANRILRAALQLIGDGEFALARQWREIAGPNLRLHQRLALELTLRSSGNVPLPKKGLDFAIRVLDKFHRFHCARLGGNE